MHRACCHSAACDSSVNPRFVHVPVGKLSRTLALASDLTSFFEMTLHLPTLMLVLVVGFLLMILELTIARAAWARSPELRIWNWGGWALLGGFVGLAARVAVSCPRSGAALWWGVAGISPPEKDDAG